MWYKINKVRPLSQAAVFMSTTEAELLVRVKEKVKALFSESLPPIVCQRCAENRHETPSPARIPQGEPVPGWRSHKGTHHLSSNSQNVSAEPRLSRGRMNRRVT